MLTPGSLGLLSGWLKPGDIPALLQVANALVVILLGDKMAIGLQWDLFVLSVYSLDGFVVRLWLLTGPPCWRECAGAVGSFLEVFHSGIEVITGR